MSQKKILNTIINTSLIAGSLIISQSGIADTLSNAFNSGRADLDMRARYETVDDGNLATQDADAYTLRTRLGFTTGNYYDFKAHADFEVINTGGDYNSGTNGHTNYAKVIDPKGEELNQAWLSYDGIDDTNFNLGRQRLILDNARFIGNVGWRQNEQTFDAFKISNKSFENVEITLAHISQINTIKGGSIDTAHNLINVSFDKTPLGKITGYTYLLDEDDSTADTDTYGLRLKGKQNSFLYTLEFSQQTDAGDNPADLDANYLFTEIGYKFDTTKIFAGYESLGSDDGNAAFQTPLATKHAFNGWADKFLVTPVNGLNDTYLKVVSKVAGLKLVGVYHDFTSDEGSSDYGTELDLVLIKPFNKTVKGIVKYADYKADSFSTDTKKIWLSLEAKFKQ